MRTGTGMGRRVGDGGGRDSHHVLAARPQAKPSAFVEVAEDAVQRGGQYIAEGGCSGRRGGHDVRVQ